MSRPKCGTPAGYRYHRKYDHYACVACSVAHKQDTNAYRIRSGINQAVRVPANLLGFLLAQVDALALRQAEEVLGEPVAEACLEIATRGES